MRLKIPKIIPGNFKSVEQAINKLAAHVLATTASPTFSSITLTEKVIFGDEWRLEIEDDCWLIQYYDGADWKNSFKFVP